MESLDIRRGPAITYAVLSLLVRLIASQTSVFNLWFSRRCYERSRGEMITMLYEKTLSRKLISIPMQPQKVLNSDGMNDGAPPREAKRPRSRLESIWKDLCGAIRRKFSTTNERSDESRKPASMGKILNMMRHASLVVFLLVSQLTLSPVTTSTK